MSIIEKPLEISSKEETNRSEKRQELTTGPSEKRSIFFFFTFVFPLVNRILIMLSIYVEKEL